MKLAVVLTLVILFVAISHAAVYRSKLQHGGSLGAKLRRQGLWHKYRGKQSNQDLRKSVGQKLIDYFNEIYLMNITIGTPRQTFTVIPDTSSADFWVIAAQCTDPQCKGYDIPKKTFNYSLSTTFIYDGNSFETLVGEEECSGFFGYDVLAIDSLAFPKQEFAMIDRLPDILGYNGIDGILGLGWPALAYQGVIPPMQNFLSQLDQPIFTVYMKRDLNQPEGDYGGEITFGGYDLEHCDKDVSWLSVSSEISWQFTMIGFTINEFSSNDWHQVSSNTGSAFIGMPETYVFGVVSEIPQATYNETSDYYTAPCSVRKTGPGLVFKFSGFDLTVPASEYIIDLDLGGDNCALAIFSTGAPSFRPSLILGDPFIRTYCNIHELVYGMIGFAEAKN